MGKNNNKNKKSIGQKEMDNQSRSPVNSESSTSGGAATSSFPVVSKEDSIRTIFSMLRTQFDVDFTHYKQSTISRRITRRMVINQIESSKTYVDFLRNHPKELQALFDDMLIGVTSFFREPRTFKALKEKVFPEILKNKAHEKRIRIWVPGCSTGEEVYTIAINLQEFLVSELVMHVKVQIFGTDVNSKSLEKARQGIYGKTIEANVSDERLNKFFMKVNESYRINKSIRQMCIFTKHDITKDPPFSDLDMICCRNVLIYFDSVLQEKIMPILHYALKANGFLILGESESVGKFTDLFDAMEKQGAVFIKKTNPSNVTLGYDIFDAKHDKQTV